MGGFVLIWAGRLVLAGLGGRPDWMRLTNRVTRLGWSGNLGGHVWVWAGLCSLGSLRIFS